MLRRLDKEWCYDFGRQLAEVSVLVVGGCLGIGDSALGPVDFVNGTVFFWFWMFIQGGN